MSKKIRDFRGKYKDHFNFVATNYEFRFNVITSLYEFRGLIKTKPRLFGEWEEYNDRVKNRIQLELIEKDLDIAENKLNILIESEVMSPDYNPFIEYFEGLPLWDKKTDYIKQMSDTVKVSNKNYFTETLTKFLAGSLHCLLEKNSVNDVCLVFQSAQGIGKTRWYRKLLPEIFRDKYLYEGNIDTRNKDHTQYLSQYWFLHLDELETLKTNEIGALKSFITQEKIALRKAFGRYITSFIRRASFLGSVNEDKFLSDTTGNRRWLVFKVISINYLHNVDVDKMWSQVYFLWQSEFRHWFDTDEIKKINENNEEFRSMPLEEEILLKCFQFIDYSEDGSGEFYTSTDVILDIGTDRPLLMSKMNGRVMGKVLSKHVSNASNRKTLNGTTKYYLKKLYQTVLETTKETPKESENQEATYVNPDLEDFDVPF